MAHEAHPIGILLCSDKKGAIIHIPLPDYNEKALAGRDQMYPPTEEDLQAELDREREKADRGMSLNEWAAERGDGED